MILVGMAAREQYVETEVKIPFSDSPEAARRRIEQQGYEERDERVLESDQLFDRADGSLRQSDQLVRLRRSGEQATVTYKGRSQRERYKSREEIEFDVSDPEAFVLVLDRLGFVPGFRYQKYRTKFAAAHEPGLITIDETPIGVFLEMEGPAEWIDRTAERLGFAAADYSTASYASLYRDFRAKHPEAGENMTFASEDRV
jgi:adenylate cyclase class 2